jgi:hypothetical protein
VADGDRDLDAVQVAISIARVRGQLAVVRYVPAGAAALVWTALRWSRRCRSRLLWMLGTCVMRAPARSRRGRRARGDRVAVAATLVGRAARGAGARQPGARPCWGSSSGGVRRARCCRGRVRAPRGMAGWEEAGAVWAETTPCRRATARLPTAATKDLRLIVRDRRSCWR